MSFEVSRFDEHRQGNESIGGKMMNSNDTLIPLIGVVTDIRQEIGRASCRERVC